MAARGGSGAGGVRGDGRWGRRWPGSGRRYRRSAYRVAATPWARSERSGPATPLQAGDRGAGHWEARLAGMIGEQPVVALLGEAVRQEVPAEAPQEVVHRQGLALPRSRRRSYSAITPVTSAPYCARNAAHCGHEEKSFCF